MAKNEKKKNTKRRLLLLLLLLILTLSVGLVGTYAWFTSNKTVNVNDMQIDVTTINGLEISSDALNWGTSIDKADLINGYTVDGITDSNQLPTHLSHVSTAGQLWQDEDGNYTGDMAMYSGDVVTICPEETRENDDGEMETYIPEDCTKPVYKLRTSDITETRACYEYDSDGGKAPQADDCNSNAHFMAFDIFLRLTGESSANTPTTLYITKDSNVEVRDKGVDNGIKNTVRVAFLPQGYITLDEYNNGKTVQVENGDGETEDKFLTGQSLAVALKNTTNSRALVSTKVNDNRSTIIWEPNWNSHTNAAISNAAVFHGMVDPDNGQNTLTINHGTRILYNGAIKPITDAILLTEAYKDETYFAPVNPDLLTTDGGFAEKEDSLIVLNAGVTKVRVYLWVEGQDVDTENSATILANLNFKLEFAIN